MICKKDLNTQDNKFLFDMLDNELAGKSDLDNRVRRYITPKRVVWKYEGEEAKVENSEVLIKKRTGQSTLFPVEPCLLMNQRRKAAVLLDFGIEMHGGIQILTWRCGNNTSAKLRIRFGESAMEAMSELGGEKNATNDHAVRDHIIDASCYGTIEIGNTGFRFVRIDLMDENSFIEIKSIRAVFVYKDIEYKGSFQCNDELLNKIWYTGAYTVHLNMQYCLWDGIKRDGMVWIGDMHPETSTIQAVFGYDDVVPVSLDFVRDETPLPGWMNGLPSYSMWWILIQHGWYIQNGDIQYLREQKDYLVELIQCFTQYVQEDGKDTIAPRFFDWPSSANEKAVEAGVHSLFIMAMDAGKELCEVLGETQAAEMCHDLAAKLRKYPIEHGDSKQAAAFMTLAGQMDAAIANDEVLSVDGAKHISTFLGYYVLKARGVAGDIQGSIDCIREYWGGMLQLGATTFWEDFNLDWMKNASRIDELVEEGKVDVHGSYGDYCYKGYRHSLCHGWASGPTAWLSEYVLGIKIVEPGCKVVKVEPELGDLEWVEGTYPTPYGIIYVRHEKLADGSIKSEIHLPQGVTIEKEQSKQPA